MNKNASRNVQAILFSLGTLGTLFAQWLISVLLPRLSGFADAGVFSLSISVLGVINIIATCNMMPFQAADRYKEYSLQTYISARYVSTALAAVALGLFALIMRYDRLQNLAFVAYYLYRFSYYMSDAYMGALQVRNRLDLVGKAMLLEGVVSFLAFVGIYLLTHNLILAMFAMAVAGGVAYFIAIRKYFCTVEPDFLTRGPLSIRESLPLLKRCFPLMIATMLPIAFASIPKIALQKFAGSFAVGIYGSLAAPTVVLTTLGNGIFSPVITSLAELAEKRAYRAFGKTFGRAFLVFALIAITALVGSILLGNPVMLFVFGEEIAPYTYLFPVLVAGLSLCAFANAAFFAMISLKKLKALLVSVSAVVCGSAVIIVAATRIGGIAGACYGTLISYAILAAVLYITALAIMSQQEKQSINNGGNHA